MVSVIIVQHNRFDLTATAIMSFRRFHPEHHELILVDNASTEGDPERLKRECSDIVMLRNPMNVGFSRANNLGAGIARGEYLLFLNNDTVTDSPYISAFEESFRNDPRIGIIGPRLRYPDGRFQLSAGKLPGFLSEIGDKVLYRLLDRDVGLVTAAIAASWSDPEDVGWVTGAAFCIRKDLFRDLGGFDEQMFMYFEDKDLCCRAGATGMKVRYNPAVSLVHIKGGSSRSDETLAGREYRRSQLLYYQKHRPPVESALLRLYLKGTGRYPR